MEENGILFANKVSLVMLPISISLGLFFIPIFYKRIKGAKRVFIVLQQISLIAYLTFSALPSLLFCQNMFDLLADKGFFEYFSKVSRNVTYVNLFVLLRDFFYLEYYFLSMMCDYVYDIYSLAIS